MPAQKGQALPIGCHGLRGVASQSGRPGLLQTSPHDDAIARCAFLPTRLEDEKDYPSRKYGHMQIRDEGARKAGVDKIPVHNMAKFVHHNGGNQWRHKEIKIPVESCYALAVKQTSEC
jgi:hypothetical protein